MKFFRFIGSLVSTFAIFLGLVFIGSMYVIDVAKVRDINMNETLAMNDFVIIDKVTKNFKTLSRFDLIVFKHPETGESMIQRIIGLPGEKVDYMQNQLYINNQRIEEPFLPDFVSDTPLSYFSSARLFPSNMGILPAQQYIVMNDDRTQEEDGRTFGSITQDDIIGVIKARIYPFERFQIL